jgi:HD-GYP domain-containing protein (c-di-GMP phosphodiesterase class II)
MSQDTVQIAGGEHPMGGGPGGGPGGGGRFTAHSSSFTDLRVRLREAGILLVTIADTGDIIARSPHGEDWLADLFCDSSMFRAVLKRACSLWNDQHISGHGGGPGGAGGAAGAELSPVEAVPGLWLAPTALVSRRRRTGYSVAVILTEKLLKAEHFTAICQSAGTAAGADERLGRSLVAQLPPASGEDEARRLITLVRWMHLDHSRLGAERSASESTGQQLAESYEEISLLYTIIQSMTVVQQPERFVSIVCEELLGTLPYTWIGAQLAGEPAPGDAGGRLKKLAGRLFIAGRPRASMVRMRILTADLLTSYEHWALACEGEQQREVCGRGDANEVPSSVTSPQPLVLEPYRNIEHARFAELGKTVLIHPVSSAPGGVGRLLGVLIAAEKQGHDAAPSSVDMKLLSATAGNMAIFLQNAAMYDDLNAMFLGTLEALTASIDAKDRYTCGHSQRVALLTQQLARAAGMSEEQVKRMHIAGLVHDVGKIGVPENVLLKPGKLTDQEFEWIRLHPEIGYRILKDIPQLSDVLPGVLHHHERWDGGGYPAGLAGRDIPHVARLISLADSFDAMSSTRTYRSAMDRQRVLAEIRACAGTQFDPELAPLFLELDFSEYDRLVHDHRASDNAARNWEAAA